MKKMLRAFPLALTLILAPLAQSAFAQQQLNSSPAEKIKADVARRITTRKERVIIKLQNGSEVKGSISQAGDSTFSVLDQKTGQRTDIAYADAAKVKGRGLSKWTKIGIVTGVAVVVVAIIGVVAFKNFDPFEHGILTQR
jgi:small nuclear ribonucleoprotein (snRNP)-like protein